MAVDRDAAIAWVNNPPSRWRRTQYMWLRVMHHVMPRITDTPMSLAGITSLLLQAISAIGIICSPFWMDAFTDQKFPFNIAATIAVILITLRLLGWVAPKIKTLGKGAELRRRRLDELATRQFNIIKEIFAALPEDCVPRDQQWHYRLADKILGCILHVAKNNISGGHPDDLQCTLLKFSGKKSDKIEIMARARDTRPSGNPIKADQTVAHFVALSGKVFVVNDLKYQPVFPYKGLSQDKASYRSILLIPVILHNSPRECVGVVTVDSPRPCEFWGDIGDNLATQLMPLMHILTIVMRANYPTLSVEETSQ